MKKLFPILIVLFLSACNTLDSKKDPDSVYLRIVNSSPIEFNSVYVSFPSDEYTFGPLKSGRSSPYQKFEQTYRYGYIEVKTERETYVLQPIDYVGERPLKSGQYTFELDIQDDHVILESKQD